MYNTQQNELFESLQLDYDYLIWYTNIDIPKITLQLTKLKNPKLSTTLSVSKR